MAFLKFYFEQVVKAYTTPDATLLPPLGGSECKSCASYQSHAAEYANSHQRYASPPGEIVDVRVIPGAVPEGQQMLSFTLHQFAATIVDANGVTVSSKGEKSVDLKAIVTWKGDQWLVAGIG